MHNSIFTPVFTRKKIRHIIQPFYHRRHILIVMQPFRTKTRLCRVIKDPYFFANCESGQTRWSYQVDMYAACVLRFFRTNWWAERNLLIRSAVYWCTDFDCGSSRYNNESICQRGLWPNRTWCGARPVALLGLQLYEKIRYGNKSD